MKLRDGGVTKTQRGSVAKKVAVEVVEGLLESTTTETFSVHN